MEFCDDKFLEVIRLCASGAVRKLERILKDDPLLVHSFTPLLDTPLHVAASFGHISVCIYLLHEGADPLATNLDGQTPLHCAAKENQAQTLEYFLEQQIIPIEMKNNFLQTPLFVAFENGAVDTTFLLLDNGADLEAVDIHGRKPIDILQDDNAYHRKFLSELMQKIMEKKSQAAMRSIFKSKASNGKLDLSRMDISFFPDEAGEILQEMPEILELDLSYNKLNTLPCSLKVQEVSIDHNPRDAIPEGFRKSWQKIQGYLESVKNRATQWTECKLLFVGQEGVGKTTLLNVFKSKSGKVNCKSNLSTNGISITPGVNLAPEMDKKEKRKSFLSSKKKKEFVPTVTFNCWDLGGQEVFYPTHQFFLTCNSVYILAFDASKPEQSRVEYWMRQIRNLTNNSTKAPVFLVGTHIDDPTCTEEYLTNLEANLTRTFARSRFRGMQGIFMISSKRGDGIPELKEKIYSVVTGKHFQPFVAPSWVRLHDLVQAYRQGNDIIEWSEYARWAETADIWTQEELLLATEFLSGVGSLIHFNDKSQELSSLVILNPQWLADVMACLITFKHSWVKDGMLQLSSIPQVFKKYPTSMHGTLLALLERFDIIHTLTPQNCTFISENKVIVTSMLPENQPENFAQAWPSTIPNNYIQQGKKYAFPFLPLGFFNRLMIRLLHIPLLQGILFWRNGMVISYRSQSAFLFFDQVTVECIVVVRTPLHLLRNRYLREREVTSQRENLLLRLISNSVDTQIEAFRMGTIQRLVACSHCFAINADPPFYFTFNECVDAITNGITTLYCGHLQQKNKAVSIENIAPDIAFADIPLINSADLIIGKEIGRGAFGIVYQGDWLGSQVAIKQLASSFVNDEAFSEFQQEVFIMSQLQSQFLVALRGVTLIPKLMMVLEFLPCGDLYQLLHPTVPGNVSFQLNTRISKENFPWSLRLLFALDIARGIHALQTNSPPIAHRDLRSPNIFLCSLDETAPVRAKVADFGLARTVAPQVFGTLDTWQWIAPEAVFDGIFDLRSDIYSLGICFWEIATRNYPFDEYVFHPSYSVDSPNGDRMLDQMKVKRAIVKEHLRPSLPDTSEGCPPEFADLIERCWQSDPALRPDIFTVLSVLAKLTGIDINKPLESEYLPFSPRGTATESISVDKQTLQKKVAISLNLDKLRNSASPSDGNNWLTSRSVQIQLADAGISPRGNPSAEIVPISQSARTSNSPRLPRARYKQMKRRQELESPVREVPQAEQPTASKDNETKSKGNSTEKQSKERKNKAKTSARNEEEFTLFELQSEATHPEITVITTLPNEKVCAGSSTGEISIYSTDLTVMDCWSAHVCCITALLCVKPRLLRKSTIWSGDSDGVLRIWDQREENSMKEEWKPFKHGLTKDFSVDLFCLFTGRGSKVWIGSKVQSELSIFDTDSVQLLHNIKLEKGQTPTAIVQVRDTVWVGTNTGNIIIYGPSAVLLLSYSAHPASITGICGIPDGESVWTTCMTGHLSHWSFIQNRIAALRTIELNHSILSMTAMPQFRTVWCLLDDGSVTVWDSKNVVPIQEIKLGNPSGPVHILPHASFVFTLCDNTIKKWAPIQ